MGNTGDEVRLLDAEIEKDTKEINELSSYIQNRYKTINDILLIPGNEGSMDIELEELEKKSNILKCLKAHRDILLQSRAVKLNKIILSETTNTTEDTQGNSYLLDNANTLHIGEETIRFQPSHADLLRFIIRETGGEKFLELQYILTYHYGIDTMSKTTLSKRERQPFEKEKNAINKLCKEALQKDLIVSLGDKKYTSSININLPKNSLKDFP